MRLEWGDARMGFDALQSYQEGSFATEGVPTQKAQRLGFGLGKRLHGMDRYYFSHGYHNKPSPIKTVRF